jgi:F-type H+-transporting ATPase subunit alpha
VREALKQPLYDPLPAAEQIAILLAATSGLFDDLPGDTVAKASNRIRSILQSELPGFYELVESGGVLGEAERQQVISLAGKAVDAEWKPSKP